MAACQLRWVFLAAAVLTAVVQLGVSQRAPVSEGCMGCICEASSGCDRTLGCDGPVCGAFAITEPYWMDAGMPVISADDKMRIGAFERCAVDPFCAAKTVQAYMGKYPKDCDGNGVINCQDYAALHTLGAGCQGTVSPAYKRQLDKCLRRFS